MKIIEQNNLKQLISEDGLVLAKKDKSEVYDNLLYLGIYDSEDNYIEITLEEKAEIIKLQAEQYAKNIEMELESQK